MKAIVTVFRRELEDKEHLQDRLKNMSVEVKEVGEAFIFSPRAGVLMEFLLILKTNKVSYGTHFDTFTNLSEAEKHNNPDR